MLAIILVAAVLPLIQATHYITKVNETVHHNLIFQDNEPWDPEMYAKKIILRNLTGAISYNTFSLLTKVEEIYIAQSTIESIQEEAFKSNPRLKILQFSYNTHLPVITNELLRNCKRLKKFSLGQNKKIEGISENLFSNLPNLTHVEITKENKIPKRLSGIFFENSKNLQSIKIHFSNVTSVDPEAFKDLDRLQFLSLVENEIVDIGAGALRSPKLAEVYLGWNKLTSFSGRELSNVRNLRNLDVSFNPLVDVDVEEIKRKAPHLKVLSVVKTGLSCDKKKDIKMKESSQLQIKMDAMELEKCEA